MSSKREFEQVLDTLPPSPYKPTAGLREVHRLFHKATEIDESVPYSYQPSSTNKEIQALIESTSNTPRIEAIKLLNVIRRDAWRFDYPKNVIRLAFDTYLDHHPPEDVDHDY